MKELELEITPDGKIRTIYSDELPATVRTLFANEARIDTIERASNVEWERIEKALNARFPATEGWSVRAAHDPILAIRIDSSLNIGIGDRYIDTLVCSRNENLAIALFGRREVALEKERDFFFDLLPPPKEPTCK